MLMTSHVQLMSLSQFVREDGLDLLSSLIIFVWDSSLKITFLLVWYQKCFVMFRQLHIPNSFIGSPTGVTYEQKNSIIVKRVKLMPLASYKCTTIWVFMSGRNCPLIEYMLIKEHHNLLLNSFCFFDNNIVKQMGDVLDFQVEQ